MITFNQYVRVKSLEEAYTLYQKKNSAVLGGMLWLKMQRRQLSCVIDLMDLGLDQIEEDETQFCIGAMASLRSLEMHSGLDAYTEGAMKEALKHIVGVQFRNVATVGGSVYGRFGFSDVLTILMAMDAKVELYKAGVMSIQDFAELPREQRDILVHVIIPKKPHFKVAYQSLRRTKTDFPVLACAASVQEDTIVYSVGATPHRARRYELKLSAPIRETEASKLSELAKEAARAIPMGSNMRGSSQYRERICEVLLERAFLSLKKGDIAAWKSN